MRSCRACGLPTFRDLCHFCSRTVALYRSGSCVACVVPVSPLDALRVEGRCEDCRSRNVVLSNGTHRILKWAAQARHRAKGRAA